ncbi:MAG: hypothetical protein FWF03_03530, partial [Defluviitaleaceae bacterium]|nr:hypothetical protein [Defluviitaleaceae bacterium]
EAVIDALAENDLTIMEKCLDALDSNLQPREAFSAEEINGALKEQYAGRKIFPLIAGCAFDDECAKKFLRHASQIMKPSEGRDGAEPSAFVYRVEFHPTLGKLAHVRMFGGRLAVRDEIRPGVKIAQLKRYEGVNLVDARSLACGDIGVLCGVPELKIGDSIGRTADFQNALKMARPLINCRIEAKNGDFARLIDSTRELCAEDPLLNMRWEPEQRELTLSVTGKMQMEVLESMFWTRFGLEVRFAEPTVIYKETPVAAGEGYEAYTMPKPCWAIIRLKIEPLPTGSGIKYESAIGPDELLPRYQAQIAQAIPNALRQGPLGWEVTDAKITLVGGNSHVYHTHPLDFIVATPMALMNGLASTGTHLLEPYMKFSLSAPEAFASKLLGEITAIRGSYDETQIVDGTFTVRGFYPLANSMDFPRRLATITSGRAVLDAWYSHYERCPEGFEAKCQYRGISPLDRAKYILHVRRAIG